MKSLLLAAALAVPLAANAETPPPRQPTTVSPTGEKPSGGTATGSGQTNPNNDVTNESGAMGNTTPQLGYDSSEAFSKDKVVQKLNKIGMKHTELGGLAKTRGSSQDVRKLGSRMVNDAAALSKVITTYAKDNNISLTAYEGSTPDTRISDSKSNPSRSGTMGGTGTDETFAGRDQQHSDSHGQSGKQAGTERQQQGEDFQAKLSELRSLQGTEFDGQFLSNVIEDSGSAVSKLNGWKGQGDSGLDRLIDRAVKTIGDTQKEALRLQGKIPAA
ncbi:MAG: DUF4142 domain-containing protein [Myxococcaceae bacterium]|nr:DUF4142 domain-containing protein [Myxococcaceae bacterium]